MASRIADCRLFLTEFRRNFRTTGALLPSGRRLSAALVHFVRESADHRPRRILEVGPGNRRRDPAPDPHDAAERLP